MKQKNLAEHFWECITSKYFQFSGRASRSEFWGYTLFSIITSFVLGLIDDVIIDTMSYDYYLFGATDIGTIILTIPGIAVGVRRFHDRDKGGWVPITMGIVASYGLIFKLASIIIPSEFWLEANYMYNASRIWSGFMVVVIIGLAIYYLAQVVQAGTLGRNQYGTDPLNPELDNEIDLIGEE